MNGTIRTFDAADGLGWIDLEDGREIRFGLTACKGFVPTVGHKVRVGGLQEAFGRLKATSVEPVLAEYDVEEQVWPEVLQEFSVEKRWEKGSQVDVRLRRVLFDREGWHRRSPEWASPSAFDELARVSSVAPRPKNPPPHRFFEPWHDALCRVAIPALRLTPVDEPTEASASAIGGDTAHLSRAWPECDKKGHGPMTLLVSVAKEHFEIFQPEAASGLVVHACAPCLKKKHHVWLGKPNAAATVNLSQSTNEPGTTIETRARLPEVRLGSEVILSFPRSWVFQPRLDVDGHKPVEGIAQRLFKVGLAKFTGVVSASTSYENAGQAYDSHYGGQSDGLFVGGFSVFRFALCPTCKHPMRQVFHLNDDFTDGQFADLFDGSNELTLLACDRTPKCGGPPKGLLVLDP